MKLPINENLTFSNVACKIGDGVSNVVILNITMELLA